MRPKSQSGRRARAHAILSHHVLTEFMTNDLIRQIAFAVTILLVLVRQVEMMNDFEHCLLDCGGTFGIVEFEDFFEIATIACGALDDMRLPQGRPVNRDLLSQACAQSNLPRRKNGIVPSYTCFGSFP